MGVFPNPYNPAFLHAWALWYAACGWQVLPCHWEGERAKQPLTRHGLKDATSDLAQVKAWWQKYPHAMIGLVVTPPLLVVDVDPRHGGTLEALARLCGGTLPETTRVRTGSGGWHLYYTTANQTLGNTAGKIAPGIDTRGGGKGYVIAPPSIHPSTGAPYTWENTRVSWQPLPAGIEAALTARKPDARPLAALHKKTRRALIGAGLNSVLCTPEGRINGILSRMEKATHGERNNVLNWAAYTLAGAAVKGEISLDMDTVDQLRAAALAAGLSVSETTATIASAFNAYGDSGNIDR
ncbi:bifunctional DNA primase/polymerase [Trueperella sp. LYQ143]|uniref:bifunctional DNA primase/polymerase n=1 Tax=Trueperella sp. LYQ143 TaxID=3391059 RepID=UPI00398303F9